MKWTMKDIYWTALLFIPINLIVGITATVLLCVFGVVQWPTWILFGVFWAISTSGITAGYHRLFSHCTYKAAWPVRFFLVMLGSSVFQGSVLEWCSDHRNHHLYTDTDKDPYSIKKGFWYAHIGWLFVLKPQNRDYSNVEDLMADPLLKFQHRFFIPIAIVTGYAIPTLIASLWGDAWSGLLIAGALRIAVVQQSTFCINSICHYFGKASYSDKQSARDNWVTALLTGGEGYHNFHHQFPRDYRNAIRFYQFDPSKWLIATLNTFGLAYDLKRVPADKIVRYQVRHEWQQIVGEGDQQVTSSALYNFIKPAYDHLLGLLKKMDNVQLNIKQLKINRTTHAISEYHMLLKGYKKELNSIKWQIKCGLSAWKSLILGASKSVQLSMI